MPDAVWGGWLTFIERYAEKLISGASYARLTAVRRWYAFLSREGTPSVREGNRVGPSEEPSGNKPINLRLTPDSPEGACRKTFKDSKSDPYCRSYSRFLRLGLSTNSHQRTRRIGRIRDVYSAALMISPPSGYSRSATETPEQAQRSDKTHVYPGGRLWPPAHQTRVRARFQTRLCQIARLLSRPPFLQHTDNFHGKQVLFFKALQTPAGAGVSG